MAKLKKKINTQKKSLSNNFHYTLMTIPGFVWLFLFSIVPMVGIVMAFQNFNPGKGIFGSKWVGLDNFKYLFMLSDAKQVMKNTIIISATKVVLNILIPLAFALLLNEISSVRYKKVVQTIVYLPHFISWVILASIILNILGYKGVVNTILGYFGADPKVFMSDASIFRQLVIGTDVWKEFGYNAVIFLAALTGVSPSLYEAATIDGATRSQQLFNITLPSISSTIVLVGILGLGSILNAGFDQVFNLYNSAVYSTGDIIDTWVYRMGLVDLQFSLATTAGILKSVISFILIVTSYTLANKFADYELF